MSGDLRLIVDRLAGVASAVGLILRAALAAVAYGALVAAGHGLALELDRPNLARNGVFGALLLGALLLYGWLKRRTETLAPPAEVKRGEVTR